MSMKTPSKIVKEEAYGGIYVMYVVHGIRVKYSSMEKRIVQGEMGRYTSKKLQYVGLISYLDMLNPDDFYISVFSKTYIPTIPEKTQEKIRKEIKKICKEYDIVPFEEVDFKENSNGTYTSNGRKIAWNGLSLTLFMADSI